jgi:serine O-acetyltransferase
LFSSIRTDFRRYHRGSPLGTLAWLRLVLDTFGLQALLVYRFGRLLTDLRKKPAGVIASIGLYPVYWLLAGYVRLAYGIRLELSADIGPGLYIGHFGGIHVANCRLGPQCSLQQRVRIDIDNMSPHGPVIGSGVWIGAHAQISGPIQIGDGVTIGAGAVVNQTIPPGCLVMGNPGRITQRDYDNSAFI